MLAFLRALLVAPFQALARMRYAQEPAEPIRAKRPRTDEESLTLAKEILLSFRRDFGPDSWMTRNQAEYVRRLQRIVKCEVPLQKGPRTADGV